MHHRLHPPPTPPSPFGLDYDPALLSALPVILTSSPSHAPIRAVSTQTFSTWHLHHLKNHAPDSVLFPFLHGLELANSPQNAFFARQAAAAAAGINALAGSGPGKNGGAASPPASGLVQDIDGRAVRPPRYRGLIWVVCEDDIEGEVIADADACIDDDDGYSSSSSFSSFYSSEEDVEVDVQCHEVIEDEDTTMMSSSMLGQDFLDVAQFSDSPSLGHYSAVKLGDTAHEHSYMPLDRRPEDGAQGMDVDINMDAAEVQPHLPPLPGSASSTPLSDSSSMYVPSHMHPVHHRGSDEHRAYSHGNGSRLKIITSPPTENSVVTSIQQNDGTNDTSTRDMNVNNHDDNDTTDINTSPHSTLIDSVSAQRERQSSDVSATSHSSHSSESSSSSASSSSPSSTSISTSATSYFPSSPLPPSTIQSSLYSPCTVPSPLCDDQPARGIDSGSLVAALPHGGVGSEGQEVQILDTSLYPISERLEVNSNHSSEHHKGLPTSCAPVPTITGPSTSKPDLQFNTMSPSSHKPKPKAKTKGKSPHSSPPLLTSTFRPREIVQWVVDENADRKAYAQEGMGARNVFDSQERLYQLDEVGTPEFVPPKIPSGISLRNFGIQVPVYATISDIVVYSPRGITPSSIALAKELALAVHKKRKEREARWAEWCGMKRGFEGKGRNSISSKVLAREAEEAYLAWKAGTNTRGREMRERKGKARTDEEEQRQGQVGQTGDTHDGEDAMNVCVELPPADICADPSLDSEPGKVPADGFEDDECTIQYNVFILDADAEQIERELPHLVMRMERRGEAHTESTDGRTAGADMDVGSAAPANYRNPFDARRVPQPPSRQFEHAGDHLRARLTRPNTIDFAQREKEEMHDLTKASEIISVFPDNWDGASMSVQPWWAAACGYKDESERESQTIANTCSNSGFESARDSRAAVADGTTVSNSQLQDGSQEGKDSVNSSLIPHQRQRLRLSLPTVQALSSASSTSTFWDPTVGQCFLGNESDVPTVFSHGRSPIDCFWMKYSARMRARWKVRASGGPRAAGLTPGTKMDELMDPDPLDESGTNDPTRGQGWDICIGCSEATPVLPLAAHLRAVEEHITTLEEMWAERCMEDRALRRAARTLAVGAQGDESVEGAEEHLRIPPRPAPHASAVVHLQAYLRSDRNDCMPEMMDLLRFLMQMLQPPPSPPSLPKRARSQQDSEEKSTSLNRQQPPVYRHASSPLSTLTTVPSSSPSPSSSRPRSTSSFSHMQSSASPASTSHIITAHTRHFSRPLKILIWSSSGYTESSVLALCLLMATRRLSLPEAYLELQLEKKRSFFVYKSDLRPLREIEALLSMRGGIATAYMPSPSYGFNDLNAFSHHPSRLPDSPPSGTVVSPPIIVPTQSHLLNAYHAQQVMRPPPLNIPASSSLPSHCIASIAPLTPNSSHGSGRNTPRARPRASTSPWLPSLISDHQVWFNDPRFDGSFPSRVLPFLYLGDINHASNVYMLHALGITHVVSVGECVLIPPPQYANQGSNLAPRRGASSAGHLVAGKGPRGEGSLWIEEREGRIKVLDIKGVCDDGIDTLEPQLEPICDWIEKARLENGQVLVHCRVGVSRSATVTIAYVMKHLNLPLVDAYLVVCSRRLSVLIQPNMRLLYNLLGWEVKLALQRAGEDEEVQKAELSRALTWPYLARQVHNLNDKYLHCNTVC